MKNKAYLRQLTPSEIELGQLRPAQRLTAHCLISFGRHRRHPHPYFSSPPSFPQKHVYGLLMGLFKRFNVLKRFVVAEIGEIEDNAVERVALPTRAWPHLCPKAKWSLLWDAFQNWMTSLAIYVLLVENKCVVLLTSKPDVRLGARIWRSPPQDVMQLNSSSRSDSRGSFCFQVFNDVVCLLVYLSYSTLTTGFIYSLGQITN